MNSSAKRLQKELLQLKKEPPVANTKVDAKENDITDWTVKIPGPSGTPYDKGTFTFSFKFASEYPFHAPEISCQHKVYHCNFDDNGNLCLDILRKENWSPMYGVKDVITSIHKLLKEPNSSHPLDDNIANQMQKDPKKFEETAKKWTKDFAK